MGGVLGKLLDRISPQTSPTTWGGGRIEGTVGGSLISGAHVIRVTSWPARAPAAGFLQPRRRKKTEGNAPPARLVGPCLVDATKKIQKKTNICM
jgi:hypothetical protein